MLLITKLGCSVLVATIVGGGVVTGTGISKQFTSSSSSSEIPSVAPVTSDNSSTGTADETQETSSADSLASRTESVFEGISSTSSSTTLLHTQADSESKEQLAEREEIHDENGNCKIIPPLKNILSAEGQEEANYYSIFCEDIGQGTDLDIPNKFEGAFSKAIFRDRNWDENKKLEIRVTVDFDGEFSELDTGEEDEYQDGSITFSSKEFIGTKNSLLTGRLKYHDFDLGDDETRSGAIVKLTHSEISEKIYLDWEDYR